MYNIIRAVGKLSKNEIPNAKVIDEIFGFSTKMIIDVSLDCQKKHKDWNYNPYTNGKFPKSQQDECVFNVPVCDCRDEDTYQSEDVCEFTRKNQLSPDIS
ncbi:hypothetical protein PTTG_26607 [Puccinia triticina 1-1 BBBD Race 1]|uniref:DUF7872 domain-containing protein n=1 Tax=Puccinia triticina (isolate 1-1 / race 1 (BBBD)) TaxID=630390 RepID=A0A180GTA1_PUCT1|nr:hypothetical protein PTTG_26607 [Puccinia triticina 1-1 BBBD Race 1]